MTRTIPAQTIRVCDRCGSQDRHKLHGFVSVDRGGTDWQGNVVGPGGLKYELCDECVLAFEPVVVAFISMPRPA